MSPMRRTSILLDPGLLAELERIAHRQGRPTAHVIREALERYASALREEHRALPAFVGLAHGPIDIGRIEDVRDQELDAAGDGGSVGGSE